MDVISTVVVAQIPVAVSLHNFIQLQPPPLPQRLDNEETSNTTKKNSDLSSTSPPTATGEQSETIAAVVHEAFSSPTSSTTTTTTTNWRFHPEHKSSLLPLVRLDIVVVSFEDDQQLQQPPITVYSQTMTHRSVHPSWEHLDQRIQVPNNCDNNKNNNNSCHNVDSCWWKNDDIYKSMRLKLFVLQETTEEDEEEIKLVEFMEAPMYPSLLKRVDVMVGTTPTTNPSSENGSMKNDVADDDHGMFGGAGDNLLPPLPPNTLLVHYSDGSIRCPSHIHQLLIQDQHPRDIAKTTGKTTIVDDFSRFEDDVFKTLDHVHSIPQRRERTASSLLDQVEEEEALHAQRQQDTKLNDKEHEEEEVVLLEEEMQWKLCQLPGMEEDTFPFTEDEILEQDLNAQNAALQSQIEEEERMFEQEMQSFLDDKSHLVSLVKELQVLNDEVALIQTELQRQSLCLQQDEILKQAISIKLVRDLQVVYPITLDTVSNNTSSIALSLIGGSAANRGTVGGYLIRGLRLPVDIYTTAVPEEEINASLGYCAHLVYMIAKYLTIQLRHRIFCNSSRSAIQQDGVGVFPLFLGRMVARSLEREQVDRGARLLGANVNCILMHLNMPASMQQLHILARLKAILNFVATGNLPSSKPPMKGISEAENFREAPSGPI
jgi:hypothetical protein